MKVVFLWVIVLKLVFFQQAQAEGFEGSITLRKQTFYDTTCYVFSVKEDMVRIDEKNVHDQVMLSLIINTSTKNVTALSPTQKMYTTIYKSHAAVTDDVKIVKTDNFKLIDGYKCYQWRVRNSTLNSDISIWVCAIDFQFFNDAITILQQTDDYGTYCKFFYAIPGTPGYFPILVEERTFLRDEKLRIAVKDIVRQPIDAKLFEVPREYKCLRN